MDWALITGWILALGGTGVVVFVAARLAGVDLPVFFASAFNAIWNVLKTVIDFVLNHLPGPIKVLLVILLIGSIGAFVAANTVGASHVCGSDGQVYTPKSWFQGWAYVNWPTLYGTEYDVKSVTPSSSIKQSNFLRTRNDTFNGLTYVDGLVPLTMVQTVRGDVSNILKLSVTNQMNYMYGSSFVTADQKLPINICKYHDWESEGVMRNVCFMIPGTVATKATNIINALNQASGNANVAAVETTGNCPAYTQVALHVVYYADKNGNMYVDIPSSFYSFADLSKCARTSNETAEGFHDAQDIVLQYSPDLSALVGNTLSLGALGLGKIDTGSEGRPVYNAYWGPLKVQKNGQMFFDVQDKTRQEMLNNMVKYVPVEGDLVDYTCDPSNADIDKRYNSTMTISGFDPFNVTNLVMVYAIIAVFVIFGWFRR